MKKILRISKQLIVACALLILISILSLNCSHTTYYRLYDLNDATNELSSLTNKQVGDPGVDWGGLAVITEIDGKKIFSGGIRELQKKYYQVIELTSGSHTIVATFLVAHKGDWQYSVGSKSRTDVYFLSEYGRKLNLDFKPKTEYVIMTWGNSPTHYEGNKSWDTDYYMWIQEKETGHIVAGLSRKSK